MAEYENAHEWSAGYRSGYQAGYLAGVDDGYDRGYTEAKFRAYKAVEPFDSEEIEEALESMVGEE